MRIIEIKEKEILDDKARFIAECNDYDENNNFIGQQSRSKFALFEDDGLSLIHISEPTRPY